MNQYTLFPHKRLNGTKLYNKKPTISLSLKRCRYSSLETFEDAFDTALYKAVGCSIFGRFLNLDNGRPVAAGEVISVLFVGPIVLDKCVKFGDPTSLNRFQ